MKRVLVTGATGFVGQRTLGPLLERGYEVHTVHRFTGELPEGVHSHYADLLDPRQTQLVLEEVRPTHLLHFAWITEPPSYWTSLDNARWLEASLFLLRHFRAGGGRRAVFAGTCAEYDWNFGVCKEQTTPLRPASFYGVCKHVLQTMLTAFAERTALSTAWGRVFFVYGPGEHPKRVVASTIQALLREEPIAVSEGNQIRDFLFVDDLARAFVELLDSTVEGPVNVASGRPLALRELLTAIGAALGQTELIRFGELVPTSPDPPLLVADVGRLTGDVGWCATTSLEAGLAQTIDWWREVGTDGASRTDRSEPLGDPRDGHVLNKISNDRPSLAPQATHTFMHDPSGAPPLPASTLAPDQPAQRTVRRLLAAYSCAMSELVTPATSLWTSIEEIHGEFLAALGEGDAGTTSAVLGHFLQTPLAWGLLYPDRETAMQGEPDAKWSQAAFADVVVSFAEAVGVKRVKSLEQEGLDAYRGALDVDVGPLLRRVEAATGLQFPFPRVGGARGYEFEGDFFTTDGIAHSQVLHRLRQLGAGPASTIVEVGGGYGCLAYLSARAGLRDVTVFDLPWVNVLQGYFFLRALPEKTVSLYGEKRREVRALPHWEFKRLSDRSVDYVVNVNSLPELGLEAAREYVAEIGRVLRGVFLSINQEAQARIPGAGSQISVNELVRVHGGFHLVSRNPWWMRQGYVEEVYAPAS